MNNNPDVFDLLGVSEREDSYNDFFYHLLSYFNSPVEGDNPLRYFIAKLLGNEENAKTGKWQIKLRPVLKHKKSDQELLKTVPDILLVNEDAETGIVIENKVLSKEGKRQTDKYAKSVEENYSERIKFKYFFLTPNGIEPQSEKLESKFEPIDYKTWAQYISDTLATFPPKSKDRIIVIAEEFIDRVYLLDNQVEKLSSYSLEKIGEMLNAKERGIENDELRWLPVLLERFGEKPDVDVNGHIYEIKFEIGQFGEGYVTVYPKDFEILLHNKMCLRFAMKFSGPGKRGRKFQFNLLKSDMRFAYSWKGFADEKVKELRTEAINILASMPEISQILSTKKHHESNDKKHKRSQAPTGTWILGNVNVDPSIIDKNIGDLYVPENNPLIQIFKLVEILTNNGFSTKLLDAWAKEHH